MLLTLPVSGHNVMAHWCIICVYFILSFARLDDRKLPKACSSFKDNKSSVV